jgi:hypothetical protein
MRPSHFCYLRSHQWRYRDKKHLYTGFFNLQQDTAAAAELHPQGRNRYCSLPPLGPSKDYSGFFGLKRPSMSVQNLFFARPAPKKPSPPLFSITGCVKRSQNVLPTPFFAYFTPGAFYLLLKVKSELASCLMTKGTFKKSL